MNNLKKLWLIATIKGQLFHFDLFKKTFTGFLILI